MTAGIGHVRSFLRWGINGRCFLSHTRRIACLIRRMGAPKTTMSGIPQKTLRRNRRSCGASGEKTRRVSPSDKRNTNHVRSASMASTSTNALGGPFCWGFACRSGFPRGPKCTNAHANIRDKSANLDSRCELSRRGELRQGGESGATISTERFDIWQMTTNGRRGEKMMGRCAKFRVSPRAHFPLPILWLAFFLLAVRRPPYFHLA